MYCLSGIIQLLSILARSISASMFFRSKCSNHIPWIYSPTITFDSSSAFQLSFPSIFSNQMTLNSLMSPLTMVEYLFMLSFVSKEPVI